MALAGRIEEILKLRTLLGGSKLMLLGILSMSLQAQVDTVRQIEGAKEDAPQENECTAATLRGPYGYFFNGSVAGGGPVAAVGLVKFDGLGVVSAKDTLNTSGTIGRRTGNGSYQINSNCTGSASLTADAGPFSFDFMVIPGSSGSEFSMIVTNAGALQTGEAIRIGERECSLATLQGMYRQSGSSFGMGVSVGFRIADGQGNYYGEDTQSLAGVIGHRMVAATYTVDGDCSGTSTFTSGSHFDSVYVADGAQKFDVRTDTGTISLGTFKKESHRWRDGH
jgi:hypothetical protein